jgi:hypothetical protein
MLKQMETEQPKKKKDNGKQNKPAIISIHQHDVKLVCTIE